MAASAAVRSCDHDTVFSQRRESGRGDVDPKGHAGLALGPCVCAGMGVVVPLDEVARTGTVEVPRSRCHGAETVFAPCSDYFFRQSARPRSSALSAANSAARRSF